MLLHADTEAFDMRQIENRRFMYAPHTGELILGYQFSGRALKSSHAEEHFESGAKEPFDSFIRGWIGTGREYPEGVIHFAPNIDGRNAELFDRAFSTVAMFRENGATGGTVIRGFGSAWEQPLSDIIPTEERSEKMSEFETRPLTLTATDTAGKVKEITEQLEQGVQELFDSERYQEYLNAMSKFHDYSINNTLLIVMQRPDASLVAGYTKWKNEFERHVKAKEKGIKILAPAPYKIKKELEQLDPDTKHPVLGEDGKPVTETQEITVPAFKVVTVFDVAQTEGKEIPDISVDTLSGSVEQYEDFFAALKRTSPVPIALEAIESGANGYYHLEEKRIAIDEGMSELQTIKTAIHEIAHAKLHDIDLNAPKAEQLRPDRRSREVEAESVAYTVCQHFGLDTAEYSFGYVAGWSSGKEIKELKASLETIRATASGLITEIEGHFAELQQQRTQAATQDQPRPVMEGISHELRQEIRDEVQNTLQMLTDADLRLYGEVSQGTLDAVAMQGYELRDGKVARQNKPEYDYQMHTNPRSTSAADRSFIQAYEKQDGGLIPKQVLFIGSTDECRGLIEKLQQGEVMPGLDYFPTQSAVISNYKGMDALVGLEGRVYLGRQENYDNHGHYDNRDNSLLYISDNEKMYGFLYGEGSILSQSDALRLGVYAKEDYAEYAALQAGILSRFEQTQQFLFDGKPFDMSQVDMNAEYPQMSHEDAMREIAGIIDGGQAAPEQDTPEKIAADLFDLVREHDPAFMEKYAGERDNQIAATVDSLKHSDTFEMEAMLLHISQDGSTKEIRERAAALNERLDAFHDLNNTFSIYQLKGGEETRNYRFEPLERLQTAGLSVDRGNYNLVYTAPLSKVDAIDTLDDIYRRFNTDHPADFTGHSLSVSDIVVLRHGENQTAHYCDSFGFTEVPQFLEQMARLEQESPPPEINPDIQPVVTIVWSESDALRDGEKMPLARAETLFKMLDENKRAERERPGYTGSWYDKTKFEIEYTFHGERDSYGGRQDFGDGDGSLIEHIQSYHEYYRDNEDHKNYMLRNEGAEAWEQDKAAREMLLSEMIPYMKLHINLSEMEHTAQMPLQEGENLTPEQAEYFNAVLSHVEVCREMLNRGEYTLPQSPQLSDFDQALQDYKAHVVDEMAQEAQSAGMTVEEYAANGYEPPADMQPEVAAVKYYPINESAARRALEANSYRDYTPGSATAEYRRYVDKAIELAEGQKARVDPMYHAKIDGLVDTYARKLAENMNNRNAIDARVPSILVAGGGNFPTRKKEKQNAARDTNYREWQDIQGLLDKIRSTGMGGISADDPQAVVKLQAKLDELVQSQETMKAVNAYYRKRGTLDGCTLMPPDQLKKLQSDMAQGWHLEKNKPFQSFQLSNNNAEIHRVQARIKELTHREESPLTGWEFEGGKVEVNKQDNRLQVFFEDKPDEAARSELKKGGFRWAPSVGAWQRQLNGNAFYAANDIKCIQPLTGERPTDLQRAHIRAEKAQEQAGQEQPKELVPDAYITGEKIQTPRGSFSLTAMSIEQMREAGYGFHHQSDDGKYLIMANGTLAFAIAAEQQESHIKTAEMSTEQNYNMIDGIMNNTPTVDELEQKVKQGQSISLSELTAAIQADRGEGARDGKKPSIREQLKAAKEQTAEQKKSRTKSVNTDLERD